MFQIGDKVRIMHQPDLTYVIEGDYDIGDTATIIALELNNHRIWYQLDVEIFEEEDQALWRDEDLELVEPSQLQPRYCIGDEVVDISTQDQPTHTIGRLQIGEEYGEVEGSLAVTGERVYYYMTRRTTVNYTKAYTEGVLRPLSDYTLF